MANSTTIGGRTVYPRAGNIINDFTIYRPEYGGAGLLDDGADFANVRSTFAGGLLEVPNITLIQTVLKQLPSGEFTDNPLLAQPITDGDGEDGGDGAFTLSELMEFEAALRGANFGLTPHQSIFSQFEDKGKGTYDIKIPKEGNPVPYRGIFQAALFGTGADGSMVPMNEATYGSKSSRAGETLDRGTRNRLIELDLGRSMSLVVVMARVQVQAVNINHERF